MDTLVDHQSPSRSPPPTPTRLWRPSAQRNIRNQWSNLLAAVGRWFSAASAGKSNAEDLVNAYLSRRYMPKMDLGVLKDMQRIQLKACQKLSQKQDHCRAKLISSYKDLVEVTCDLIKTSSSMRCFLKGSGSSLIVQFSCYSKDENDLGDGGGIPVFSLWSVTSFEEKAKELVEMFVLELSFKRLIVVDLLSVSCQEDFEGEIDVLSWSNEVYQGEFDYLSTCCLLYKESHQPLPPRIKDWDSESSNSGAIEQPDPLPNREVLEVYLTSWLANLNIDMNRLADIVAMVEEEMQVKLPFHR